jgi:putative hydroxymethylpyrimidine transport system substrate-binding protein
MLVALIGLSAACGSDPTTGPAQPSARKLTVLLDWEPNPDHVGLYAAQRAGYYAEQGLDVALQPPADPADPVKLVSTGTVDLGISYEPEVVISAAQDLDVVAVAALVPTALNSIVARGDAGIRTPADLAGKTVGTAGLQTDDAFLDAIFSEYSVEEGSVKRVDVAANLVSAMVSGNVDATIGSYRNVEGVIMEDRGLDPTIIPVTEAGVPDYDELVIIANRSRLANDPAYQDMVRDFLAATAHGQDDVIADPAVGVEAVADVADGYDPELVPKMVAATVPLLRNDGGFGRVDVTSWQSFADWMADEGLIDAKVSADDVVMNDYLPRS